MSIFNIRKIINYNLHLSDNKKFLNNISYKFIYKSYKNTVILDFISIKKNLLKVFIYIYYITKLNKDILFISSNKLNFNIIKKISNITSNYFITCNWKKGMLTNWNNMKNKLLLLKWFNIIFDDTINKNFKYLFLSKFLSKVYLNLKKNCNIIKSIPKTVFVVDPILDKKALYECKSLNLNIISIFKQNIDCVKYIIPSNNNILSLNLIFQFVAVSVLYSCKL